MEFALETQGRFGFLELLVNDTTEDLLLINGIQRVRGEVDTALSQLGKVGFVGAGGQELVCVLRGEPDGKSPRAALAGKLAEQASLVLPRQ